MEIIDDNLITCGFIKNIYKIQPLILHTPKIEAENRKRREALEREQQEEIRRIAHAQHLAEQRRREKEAKEKEVAAAAKEQRIKEADDAMNNMTLENAKSAFRQAVARIDALHIRPVIVNDVLKRGEIDSNSLFGNDKQDYPTVAPYLSKIAIDTFNRTLDTQMRITEDIVLCELPKAEALGLPVSRQ